MAYSKITIDFFDEVPLEHDFINILESNFNINLNETFRFSRLATGQSELPTITSDPGTIPVTYTGFTANGYRSALDLDYNSTGLFTITKTVSVPELATGSVTITANYPNAVFSVSNTNSSAIITIENETTVTPITIDSVVFSQASSDPSGRCQINVATNHLATKLLQPFIRNSNTENPIIFAAYRAMSFIVEVEDSEGLKAIQNITTPDYLNIDNFTLNINNSPNGATVTAIPSHVNGLELKYSLNGTDWQDSNVFPGLDVGIFLFWVKDQLGAVVNKNFTVDQFGIYTPYFYISKSNSIRFANRITFGDSQNYKNDENTLSCEVDVLLPKKEIQLFQSADIVSTQFKSNFATNTAKIIKSDLSEVNIPVVKKSNNIGINDKRDARMYDLGNGKTGVYFLAGNIYDFSTNAITGTYALNGSTPEWAQSGNYIVIDNAWFLIEDVVFDESKNADVIVFTNTYSGTETVIISGSIFNRFNYEVYEFIFDMVDYIDQKFRVKIENTDANFTAITHLSELIWCKVKHDDVLEIKYWNSTNTDVFYGTGIQFLIRVPYLFMRGKVDENSEVHKTDTDAILLNTDMYEVDEIQFKPLTKELWRKLMIALSHEKVLINGVGYVKNGGFNTEGPLGNTNLYVLTAIMIKTGNVYNSQTSGNLDFDGTAVEVPGLIETDGGYVSY